ncbi:hypothetical protein C9374_003052 [Naegleria lovaniensis]|uniref:AMP-dependent synthetase/ligase domain-containing protein n=1 Tax=Naegleria lovaniensis TaxID=51637 RepID=A0AA88GTT8_NAELO|nr:uncharacterized protein C9374_003052 [Naegleria lovaniensis]KAG2385903.1 hypothetical protein C9374_003052 [Naegleria lovaniensis]
MQRHHHTSLSTRTTASHLQMNQCHGNHTKKEQPLSSETPASSNHPELDTMLWRPSLHSMQHSVMYSFAKYIMKRYQTLFLDQQLPLPAFMQVRMEHDPVLFNYLFHQWSISDDRFWGLLWRFLNIKASREFTHVLKRPSMAYEALENANDKISRMNGCCTVVSSNSVSSSGENTREEFSFSKHPFLGSQFFVGAQTNYAQNLMVKCLDPTFENSVALVSLGEQGVKGVKVERREITYGELWNQVSILAHYLKNELGIKKTDRCVALLPNSIEAIIALLAVTSLGAIWSSVSPDNGKRIVFERFKHIEPVLMFTCDHYTFNGKVYSTSDSTDYLQENLPSLKSVVKVKFLEFTTHEKNLEIIKCGVNPSSQQQQEERTHSTPIHESEKNHSIRIVDYSKDIMEPYSSTNTLNASSPLEIPSLEFEQVSVDHPIHIVYTSGSTGAPKCISQGFGVLINHIKETHLHCDITEKDTVFVYSTCGWMMWNWLVSCLYTGCKIILYDGSPMYPDVLSMWKLIEQEKITVFGTSSRYLSLMVTHKVDLLKKTPMNLSHLRLVNTTGSPLAPSTAIYLYNHMIPNVQLSSISGGTDLNGCFVLGSPFLPVYPGELQTAGLGLNVQVWNDEGQRIFGKNGELVCLNPFPSAPLFFWGDATPQRYHDSYFSQFDGVWAQGDLSEQTKRFGFYVIGRSDATLNPGGVRLGTGSYYDVLQHVDEVVDSVVVGQRQQDGNERVVLFVQLQPQLDLDEKICDKINTTIRTHLSARHKPSVIVQTSGIPINANGKKMEKFVKKLVNQDKVQPSEISSLKNPECVSCFIPSNWKTSIPTMRTSKL